MAVGAFNPAIFHPWWFGQAGLLSAEEAKAAKVEVVHRNLAAFSTDWLSVQVTDDRFMAVASDAGHAPALRDLVVGTFSLLEHTPVRALGFNRQMHFRVADEEKWHAIGDALAPKTYWEKALAGRPGMRVLVIQGERPSSPGKYVQIRIEPSVKVTPGVYVLFNEHFDLGQAGNQSEAPDAPTDQPAGAGMTKQLVDYVVSEWEPSSAFGLEVAQRMMNEVA